MSHTHLSDADKSIYVTQNHTPVTRPVILPTSSSPPTPSYQVSTSLLSTPPTIYHRGEAEMGIVAPLSLECGASHALSSSASFVK